MSILPHQRQQQVNHFKQGHPCQPPIKHYIYNAQRKDLKHLLNTLKSIKELSNVFGEKRTKVLLYLMSQDNATSDNIFKNACIYKKHRNLEEFKYTSKRKKLKRVNSF